MEQQKGSTGKLGIKTKAGYAVASIGDSASYTFINTYLVFFLTTVAGVDAAVAGAIAAAGAILDAAWGPIIGYISDNSKSPHGRRRPFIFRAAFPLAVASALLFTKVGGGGGLSILYYAALAMGFWVAFATYFVPYATLGAEITDDYDERSSIRSFAYVGNQIGMFFGMASPPFIVGVCVSLGSAGRIGWTAAGVTVGLVVFISLMITVRATRGRERAAAAVPAGNAEGNAEKAGFKPMLLGYREILGLKPMRILVVAAILALVSFTMCSSARMYFFTYNLGLSESISSIIMLIYISGGIVFAPFVLKLSQRLDRRRALIIGSVISSALLLAQYAFGISTFAGACAMVLTFSLFSTSYWQLMPAIIYDICELDELENGVRREGSVVSILSFSEAISSAIALQLLGVILKISGFSGELQTQPDTALVGVGICAVVLPAALSLATAITMRFYPIGKKEFENIRKELERKRGE
ncbi:MAG: MFS transporter [Clostridiales Family XIII bacterium]|jgi:GPH family glycoside/pentoside/hexuronide:cation symporter|nr:MFS transporter [Clostridiales Family XIII bacterium]